MDQLDAGRFTITEELNGSGIDDAQFLQVQLEVCRGAFNEGPQFRKFAAAKLSSQEQNRKFPIERLVDS
jgi:hypothetical protein